MAVDLAEPWVDEPRIDTRDKVTGAAIYIEDMPSLPGTIYAVPLESRFAHARIRGIDASQALRLPGVLALLDASSLAAYGLGPLPSPNLNPSLITVDRARFEGDLLGLVLAEDLRTARRAAQLVEVQYEMLPPVFSAEEALAPGAPLLHEELGTNSVFDDSFEWGDVERGLREADRVFESTFFSPTVFHHPLEPIGTGLVDFTGDVAQLWAPSNTPVRDAEDAANALGLRPDQVRLRMPCVGGGFGAKDMTRAMVAALAASRRLKRPIKLVATGGQSFQKAVRHAMTYRGRMGVSADGRIVALDVGLVVDCGAYFAGGRVATHNACISAWGCYRIPHFRAQARTAFTNKVPATPHRGTGKTQTTYAVEMLVDQVAREMGIDPVEFRRANVLLPGERVTERWTVRGQETPAGVPPLDVDLPDLMDRALAALDQPRPAAPLQGTIAGTGSVRSGRAVALCLRHASKGDQDAMAMATIGADGIVTISHNAADLGQGIYNMINIVSARTLDLPRGRVRVEEPDTSNGLAFAGATAQRVTVQMGNAVRAACENLKRQLIDLAVESIGGEPGGWRLVAGELRNGEQRYDPAEVLRIARTDRIRAVGSDREASATDEAFGGFEHWSPGVAAAEVEVDTETGEMRLLQYSIVADAGTLLHRRSAAGQVEGGAVMGLGIALGEELVYDEGQVLNADAFQYRLPLIRDVPESFFTTFIEKGDGPGPFGSKGVSQTSIPCVAPAIGNAIAAATGAVVTATPFTGERILRALGAAAKNR